MGPRPFGFPSAPLWAAIGLLCATGDAFARPRSPQSPPTAKSPAARSAKRDLPPRFGSPDAAATRIAAVSAASCLEELRRRDVPFRSTGPEVGVEAPVRLLGPVDGVTYRTDFPDAKRGSVPWEVFDCRLVLALVELGPILRAHSISEVRIYCAYRPPTPAAATGPLHAHPAGLALDVRAFRKSTGETLEVESDFHGRLGASTCGRGVDPEPEGPSTRSADGADAPDLSAARELREIYCAAAGKELFHVQLSPNHDASHHNHFHLEVRPGVRWFIVR